MNLRTILSSILIAMAGISSLHALPDNFSLEGRTVLVDGPALKAAGIKPATSGDALLVTLTKDETNQAFALRVTGAAVSDDYRLFVNDKFVEIAPIPEFDGQWFSIPERTMLAGENTIRVLNQSDKQPVPAENLYGFSINFAEEEHLNDFVGIKASPPTVDNNQYDYDVQHMDIAITMNTAAATIPGAVVTLTAKSLVAGLTQCVLDFNDNGGLLVISDVDSVPSNPATSHVWNTGTERLVVTLPAAVAQGANFTVQVTYSGTPFAGGARGYMRSTHNSGTVPVIYTNNQPYDARRWFPCKDLPEDKFTVEMHATVPTASYNGYPFSVVSNGTLMSVVPSGGNTTYNWKDDYEIATQYVSLAASNYRVASGTYTALDNVTVMPVAHHVYEESYVSESQELPRTIEVMDWMADTFGEYPFVTEKYVTATWPQGGGLEHQTCTSMPNGNLNNPPYHRRNVHEMAHMWFGVCVGNETFDHLWISEGWASYVEALWRGFKNGDTDYKAQMATFRSSSSDAVPIISSTADSFNQGVTYYKAAYVLHMLRHVVGDTAFFQATKDYLADPALRYKTAVSADFQNHVEQEYGQDLDWFFDEWLTRTTRPSYQWLWSARQVGSDWFVDIGIDQTQALPYQMPIDFRVTKSDLSTTTIVVNNTQDTQSFSVNIGTVQPTAVTFDPDSWLLYGSQTNMVALHQTRRVLTSVVGNGVAHTATITWAPSSSSFVIGYRLYQSLDGLSGWTLVQDVNVLDAADTSAVVTGLAKDDSRYFRVSAVGVGSQESTMSDVYGTRIGAGAGLVLVVDGYDRLVSGHNYVATNGRAIAAHTNPFDSCANEAVDASIALANYPVVAWICAEESTADQTFSTIERGIVTTYLQGGGKLFVTGNEIALDMDAQGSVNDRAFFNNYLKADYVSDDSNDYGVTGSGTCFGAHAFTFGGGDAPYLPDFPDVVAAINGSASALMYDGVKVAGVEFKGMFTGGASEGGVVMLGFGFETVDSEAQRIQMMDDVLNFFEVPLPAGISHWEVY